MSFALIALSIKTVDRSLSTHAYRNIYYSEINQYGYLVHEVTTFMDMILNGERGRKASHKMTGIYRTMFLCTNFSDF